MAVGVALFLTLGQLLAYSGFAQSRDSICLVQTPEGTTVLSDESMVNMTEIFESLWNQTSEYGLGNLTKDLTEQYPSRVWSSPDPNNLEPSQNLIDAWQWANETLLNYTNNELGFKHVTKYESLVAIKNGTGALPRPAIIVSGMIDSDNNPGANDAGISVAAVLELARVLNDYELNFDLYFVLINGAHIEEDVDLGSKALVEWLEEHQVETYTAFAFDRLLFHRSQYVYGNLISLRSFSEKELYHQNSWIPDLMIDLSSTFGHSWIQQVSDLDTAERSLAHEMWEVGRPAIHVAQGFFPDPYASSEDDTWDRQYYSFQKPKEAVAIVACVLANFALIDEESSGYRYQQGTLYPTNTSTRTFTVSISNFVNVSLSWTNDTTMQASIIEDESETVVYQRTESDGFIQLKYLSMNLGIHNIRIENIGSNGTKFWYNFTQLEDFDGDTLSNQYEFLLNTSPFFLDSDFDGLDDDFEVNLGTDPTAADSDGDGALDYDEYIGGSSLLLTDSDSDGISDGQEAELGTSPIKVDSDGDGIGDFEEWTIYLTDPTRMDTDFDGLDDGFEIEAGLDPLSPDSDGDSLSDLFEVLNQLDPTSRDTDGDGWSDAYEVEDCLSPTNPDTDFDGLPDGIDWDPQEHWVSVVAPVGLLSIIMLAGIYSFMKYNLYTRNDEQEE
jgi:hypothetical protein